MNSICIVPTMKQTSRIQPKRMLGAKMLGTRNKYMSPLFLAIIIIFLALAPISAWAGMKEAKAAYEAKDYKTAFKEYLPLAEAGNYKAQYWIGHLYRYGYGRKQNYKTAVSWFKRAVNNGAIATLISLGYMAGKGYGMPKSVDNEICYYRYAAERGNETAQWSLYLTLDTGFFTSDEAWDWLVRSAKQGESAAMAQYGVVLLANPIRSDKSQGYMYLWLAHLKGTNPYVLEYINDKVGNNSRRKRQLAEGKKRAAKWKPVKEIPPTDLPPIDLSKCEK